MAEVAQRVVIITGCSTGIGLDTAVFLAKNENKKYKVYACMRNLAKKDKLLEKAGDCIDKTLFILEMDVKSESSVNAAIKHVLDTDGKVDVLSKYNIVHDCTCQSLEYVTAIYILQIDIRMLQELCNVHMTCIYSLCNNMSE